MHEGGNSPAVAPVGPTTFFLLGASVELSVLLLHRHRAIIWYAFGVAWLNTRGVGLLKRLCFVLECGFAEFLYRGLPLSFKAQCPPQITEGLCLAGCHVVAQTQGYHLVCIWGSRVKFQGGGVVVKFDVFLHSYAVCLCCLHASNDPLC